MPEEMCSLKFQLALNSTEMPGDSSQVLTLLLVKSHPSLMVSEETNVGICRRWEKDTFSLLILLRGGWLVMHIPLICLGKL